MTRITLLDGGLSREITRFGAKLTQPEWSAGALMRTPDAIQQAHQAFFDAGAEIATTATYAVVPFHIGQARFDAQGAELAALSGKLARTAADAARAKGQVARVAGCLPPTCGSYLPEDFDLTKAEQILPVLVDNLDPFVDFWLAETMSCLAEMRAAVAVVRGTNKAIWLACSLRDDDLNAPPVLRSGETVEEAARLAADLGAEGLLFNCSLPEVMESAVVTARQTLADLNKPIPLGVYANGFVPNPREGDANEAISAIRGDLGPADYLRWAEKWVAAGATVIGGCCGIGSAHIAELKAHLCE